MVFDEAHVRECGRYHALTQFILLVGECAVNTVFQLVFDIQFDVDDAPDNIIHRLLMLALRSPEKASVQLRELGTHAT